MKASPSIGQYLIDRLYTHGVRHVFGIPGDYVLGFYAQLLRSKLHIVNTCDEQGAGFAADAYARIRGLGAVCITYCVGGLKVANPTAEAYAEKSPVVIISGAPGTKERIKNPLLHHKVREFDTQLRVFEQLTVASTVLHDPHTALAPTMLGNSVIAEHHPLFIAAYEGAMGNQPVRDCVESSDCLILLGAFMSDMNLGFYTAELDQRRSISVSSEKTSIRYHIY